MTAYHNRPALKAFLLRELRKHRAADRLVKGQYWKNGKGCAVACTLEAVSRYNGNKVKAPRFDRHSLYRSELGIPEVLAHLEDKIFEGLPEADAMEWPQRFATAIKPGADLSMVWPKFALWMLEGLRQRATNATAQQAVADVAALYREWVAGRKPARQRWKGAADAAWRATTTAAWRAAAAAYATAAAATTADAAAYAAAYAAADAVDRAANAAAHAGIAFPRQADKLEQLLRAAR